MEHAMYLSTLVVTKFYRLSDRNNSNVSLAFPGAGRFRLDLALGYRERLLSWCVDCHHLLPHVTSPLIVPSEFLLQGHHSLSVED